MNYYAKSVCMDATGGSARGGVMDGKGRYDSLMRISDCLIEAAEELDKIARTYKVDGMLERIVSPEDWGTSPLDGIRRNPTIGDIRRNIREAIATINLRGVTFEPDREGRVTTDNSVTEMCRLQEERAGIDSRRVSFFEKNKISGDMWRTVVELVAIEKQMAVTIYKIQQLYAANKHLSAECETWPPDDPNHPISVYLREESK